MAVTLSVHNNTFQVGSHLVYHSCINAKGTHHSALCITTFRPVQNLSDVREAVQACSAQLCRCGGAACNLDHRPAHEGWQHLECAQFIKRPKRSSHMATMRGARLQERRNLGRMDFTVVLMHGESASHRTAASQVVSRRHVGSSSPSTSARTVGQDAHSSPVWLLAENPPSSLIGALTARC